jgi:hypothetical protein
MRPDSKGGGAQRLRFWHRTGLNGQDGGSLPQGEDPDSLIRKEGAEAFAGRIVDAAVEFSGTTRSCI